MSSAFPITVNRVLGCGFIILALSQSVKSLTIRKDIPWTTQEALGNGFNLSWYTEDSEWLIVELKTERVGGWTSIGFSPKGGMAGADMVIAWFDRDGRARLRDTYGVKNGRPLQDETNDYELIDARQDEGGMSFRIRRKWNTCDTKHDYTITNDTVSVIFAHGDLGPEDEIPVYHGPTQRGTKSLYLAGPTKLAPYPDEYDVPNPDIEQIDILLNNITVPGGVTTRHMCQMMKYPAYDKKRQIIGFKPIIQKENYDRIHHIIIYECFVPDGDSAELYEKDVGKTAESFTRDMPPHWGQYCASVPLVWNHGAEGDMLPDHLGIAVGEQHGGATYFVFEIHYDIPDKSSFTDSSGIRIFLTDRVRPHDLTCLVIGSKFSAFAPLLTPGVRSHVTSAACTPECTETMFPSDGISAYSVILHGHAAAKRITLRHVRNRTEMAPLFTDNHYDWKYEQARLIKPERKILPGDMLMVDCEYDTTDRDDVKFGSVQSSGEMCVAFFNYYPKINLVSCQWQTSLKTVVNALGITKVGGKVMDALQLPYNPKKKQIYDLPDETSTLEINGYGPDPFPNITVTQKDSDYRGKSLSQVFDSIPWKANDWKLSKDASKKIENGNYYAFCTKSGRVPVPLKNWLLKKPTFQTYVEKEDDYCKNK